MKVPMHTATSAGLVPECSIMPRPVLPMAPMLWASSRYR